MMVSLTKTVTPDEQELKKRLKQLKRLEAKLTQNELDLATLRAELREIDLRYNHMVGSRLAKLELIEARITEILSNLNAEERAKVKSAKQDRPRASDGRRRQDENSPPEKDGSTLKLTERLRTLYREAAKCMHPDLAEDDSERELRNQWMVEINAAYQADDEERLASLLEKWMVSPEGVQGFGTQANLERTIRKIAQVKDRLKEIRKEIERLRTSFAYSLREQMEAAELDGHNLLDEMSEKLEQRIMRKQDLLDSLKKNVPSPVNAGW
jgi:hypothetical protein